MHQKKIIWRLIGIFIFLFGIALESGAAPKGQPKKTAPQEQPRMGGTLVVGLGKETGNPNPFFQTMSTNQFVKDTSYESLLIQDDEGRIVPNLAEKYDVAAGGTQFTLHLRKGVKFHNGKELRAEDVVWSTNHVKDPKNGAFGQNRLNDVKSVEKMDSHVVKFTLGKPSAAFLANLATIRILPIVPENSLQPGQTKLEKNVFVPGTGAFMFEQFQPGFDTVVKKAPDYWGKPAYLDKIMFRPITDNANRFNALRTGDVQMADRLAALDAMRVKKGDVKGIALLEEPLGGFQRLIFNYDSPLLQKREMRQALACAIDKQRLVDEAFFGAAQPAELMMDPQGIWSKAAKLPRHKRDLAKARVLLKAAGYNGQELVWVGRNSATPLLESVQRMLSEAGIKVKLEILEAGVMRERVGAGKFDLQVGGATTDVDPVIALVSYYYTNKVEKGSYSNPKTDQLFDKFDKEFDEKKRLAIFRELAGVVQKDVADVPLLFEIRYLGMGEKVRGYGPPPGHTYSESGTYFKSVWLR